MSSKAVDSQSKEQGGKDIGDNDAGQGGGVQLHAVLTHCGEGQEERLGPFQGQEATLPPGAAPGSLQSSPELRSLEKGLPVALLYPPLLFLPTHP